MQRRADLHCPRLKRRPRPGIREAWPLHLDHICLETSEHLPNPGVSSTLPAQPNHLKEPLPNLARWSGSAWDGTPQLPPLGLAAIMVRHRSGHDARAVCIREDPQGWTIYDRLTNEPAVVEGYISVGLPYKDADELVDLLNTLDLLKRKTTLH